MILRKINAVLSLLTTLLVLNHAIFNAVWMLSQGGIHKTANGVTRILAVAMLLHAILSIVLGIMSHKGRKGRAYPKLNAPTIVQRISGVLLLVLTVLHIGGAIGFLRTPPALHAILPPLFFAVVLIHTSISAPKAFVTLGIGNAWAIRVLDIAIKAICALTFVAATVGFYLLLV